MANFRTAQHFRAFAGAKFRCLVCRRFTTATAEGVCPRCGVAPPVVRSVFGRRKDPSDLPTGPEPHGERYGHRRSRIRWVLAATFLLVHVLVWRLFFG